MKKKSTKPKAVRVRHGGMMITARKRKGGWFHDVSEFHGPYRSARAALQEAAELVDLANS